jgi:hypoxanthine-DNA glycosylase
MRAARGLEPVIDARIETLILGSFPGVASLGKAQYYAHPQNQFWRLLGAALDEPLPAMDYAARTRTLLEHRIGLWDVIGRCVRAGSLDTAIRDARHNDFTRVTGVAKNLRRVFFNGKTAGRFERQFAAWGYETAVLPSSSPAYTLRYEDKLGQWRRIAMPPRTHARKSALAVAASRPTPQPSRKAC